MATVEFSKLMEILDQISILSSKQKKSLAHYLVTNATKIKQPLNELLRLLDQIQPCSLCQNFTDQNLCQICRSEDRQKQLMIIEDIDKIEQFEKENLFQGKYYLVPILYNKKFEQKPFDFQVLLNYLDQFDEVILALNSTSEGILTANLIIDQIKTKSQIKISQLATGIPLGTKMEYIDDLTLNYALKNRKELD